jgi:hypothetical protein
MRAVAPAAAADRTARLPRFLLPRSHAACPVDRGQTAECSGFGFDDGFHDQLPAAIAQALKSKASES